MKRLFAALLLAVLATGLFAPALWAAPDIAALGRAFAARLDAEIGNPLDPVQKKLIAAVDTNLKAEFVAELTRYVAEDVPTGGDQTFVDTFEDNVKAILAIYTLPDLNLIRKERFDNPKFAAGAEPIFRDLFQNVTFFTLASDDVLDLDAADQTADWSRAPVPRLWDNRGTTAEQMSRWNETWRKSWAFRIAFKASREIPTHGIYGTGADPNRLDMLAGLDRKVWLSLSEDWLTNHYSQVRPAPYPEFFSDLAHLHYVMIGMTMDAGQRRMVGATYLAGLEAQLAPGLTPDGTPLPPPLSQDLMRATEIARGFRIDAPMPGGFLPGADFNQLLAAGYMLDDQGAGAFHGPTTHSLQMSAFMAYCDEFPDAVSVTPVELIAAIGAFDGGAPGTEQLFSIERPFHSVWGAIMDLSRENDVAPDMSHPDQVRQVIREDREIGDEGIAGLALPRLSRELETTFREHLRRGTELREMFQRNENDPALPSFSDPERARTIARTRAFLQQYKDTDAFNHARFQGFLGDQLRVFELLDRRASSGVYKAARIPDGAGGMRRVNAMSSAADTDLKSGRSDPEAVAAVARAQAHRDALSENVFGLAPLIYGNLYFEMLSDISEDDVAEVTSRAPLADDDDDAAFDADGLDARARKAIDQRVIEAVAQDQPAEAAPAPPDSASAAPPAHAAAPGEPAMTVAEQDAARLEALRVPREDPTEKPEARQAVPDQSG